MKLKLHDPTESRRADEADRLLGKFMNMAKA